MLENLKEDLSVESLADRNRHERETLHSALSKETRMNPGRFGDKMRVEAGSSCVFLGSRRPSTKTASKAWQFGDPEIITCELKPSRTCFETSYRLAIGSNIVRTAHHNAPD
jgi:hypothetical protein